MPSCHWIMQHRMSAWVSGTKLHKRLFSIHLIHSSNFKVAMLLNLHRQLFLINLINSTYPNIWSILMINQAQVLSFVIWIYFIFIFGISYKYILTKTNIVLFFNEGCDSGEYGENCSIPCGYCFESEQCNHINGTCMNGCDSGYQGVLCTESKAVIL